MVAVARDRSRILQNVVTRVRDWGRFIKIVKRSVSMQDAAIALRANRAKQRVGCEVEKYRISYVSVATIISFDSAHLSAVEEDGVMLSGLVYQTRAYEAR